MMKKKDFPGSKLQIILGLQLGRFRVPYLLVMCGIIIIKTTMAPLFLI
jgi:hypothetical protein